MDIKETMEWLKEQLTAEEFKEVCTIYDILQSKPKETLLGFILKMPVAMDESCSYADILSVIKTWDPPTITITFDDSEYRVPGPDRKSAYYTDDRDDAIMTAKTMFGQNVKIKFRKRG